jgi:hypothetical protein
MISKIVRNFGFSLVLAGVGATASLAGTLDGRWDATLQTGKVTVPFRLDI